MRARRWLAVGTLLAFALAGCDNGGSNGPPQPVTLDKTFGLRLGKSAVLSPDNVQITFVKVNEDSRCPTDVQCAWAGQAIIRIQVTPAGGKPATADLTLEGSAQSPGSAKFGPYIVEFRDLEPVPTTVLQIKPGDYVATLIFGKQ